METLKQYKERLMRKVQMFRMSGAPVDPEDFESFREEWKNAAIKIEERCKLGKDGQDILRANKLYARVERILTKKYPTVIEVDFIKTKKDWNKMMDMYGNIVVTRHRHTNEMLYMIWDEENGRY